MTPERTPEMKEFLHQQRDIFWHLNKEKLHGLSDDVIVEYVLNYGDYDAVKDLFAIWGTAHVAEVFYRSTALSARRAKNYFPQVLHYFDRYFKRHAPEHSQHRTVGTAADPSEVR
ncbi:MAG: hypothetical protein K9J06_08835 [Flavobacteriales bacterium]|nr:hypothetical protein [Flavobacteriales bacterium]